jgi:uncharacterized membrane protein YkgB
MDPRVPEGIDMPHRDVDVAAARERRLALAERVGIALLRYGVVLLLLLIGGAKYFAFEAAAIEPLVANSPLLSWMPRVLGLQGASNVIGTLEIATGLAIAARPLSPALSAAGSAAGALTFLVTLSFLFSTPGALSLAHPAAGFLLKDVVLLGACVATCAEALRAARPRAARTARVPGVAVHGAVVTGDRA